MIKTAYFSILLIVLVAIVAIASSRNTLEATVMPSKVCHPLGRVVLVVLEANQLGATNSSPPKETPQNGRTVW